MRMSVVIPTFNSGPLVVEALESALAQTVPPGEIIVVDDGSTDDTRQRLQPFRDRIRYFFQPNQGVSEARNAGLARAGSDWIAFLDADDVWHPRKLERQGAILRQRPELGLLGTTTFAWPGEMPEIPDHVRANSPVMVPIERLIVKNYFTTSSVVIRRDLLGRSGAFDRQLRGPEDYDLWLRVAAISPVANLNEPLTGYRIVAGSLSRQADAMERGMRRVLTKVTGAGRWPWWLRRKANSYCDYSCAYMHAAAGHTGVALRRLVGSLAWYPWPYRRDEVRMPLARPRMFAALLRQLITGRHGRKQ